MKAGFIGLGAMGANMARNVAKTGLLEAVWNRTGQVAAKLAGELKVDFASSPAYLALQVDVVLICVSDDVALLNVVEALLPGLGPGITVVDHSTVSVDTARKVAEKIRSLGADFLDAPVSGGVEGAKNGTLSIMVGGKSNTLLKVRPILETMARRVVHVGDVGTGQATKAVNQVMCAGINQAVVEALAFGEAQGLNMDKAIQAIAGGAAGNWFLDKRGRTMTHGTFTPGFKLALHHKDLKICMETGKKLGVLLPLTEQTLVDYAELMKQGYGDEDISALYRLKRPSKPGKGG
jgi:3-hydroxyisobutyrate dehydrogenase